jgi:hypothetical protein
MARASVPLATGILLGATLASAQVVPFPPQLQGRIPPPLTAPSSPPTINGPLGRSPPPGVHRPSQLNTFSDRRTRCLHEGAGYGLHGRQLNSYVHTCTN